MLNSLQRRFYTKILNWNWKNVCSSSTNDAIELIYEKTGKNQKLIIPLIWLRDHCQSEKYYHFPTNQRKNTCTDLVAESCSSQIIVKNNATSLEIIWDDGHISNFDIESILAKACRDHNPKTVSYRKLWDKESGEIQRISSKNLQLSTFSEKLVKFGVVIVEDVEATAESTENLCESLIPVHDTFFGQFWVFSNSASEDENVHEDTAYSNEEIGPHTDGTYFNQTPGIQVFHCLQPAKTGGDTVLVDSFNCAETLKSEDPESFRILTDFKIAHHYLEGNPPGSSIHSVSAEKPIIEVDSYGNIVQIRFNPYDRAPFQHLSDSQNNASEVIKFYKAYQAFARLCNNPKNAVKVPLRPGSVIFIDNFRVLHSRTGFQGYRQMCGCYLSRDNFYAKARPFLPENLRKFI